MKNLIVMKSVTAGALGTLAMTIFAAMAPLMGMPEMNVPKMLSGAMGLPMVFGWVAHFMVGIVLALLYATVFYNRFKGSRVIKGIQCWNIFRLGYHGSWQFNGASCLWFSAWINI